MDVAPIVLLTDFGSRDVFVGVMKGVVAGIAPDAQVIDLCHDVPRQDVRQGGFYLSMAYRYFPAGTVFVAVVDPGVGSSRRAVAVAMGDQYFVAPDNGLLGPIVGEATGWEAVDVTSSDYRLKGAGSTFDGRDVFAPIGAYLAGGLPLQRLGPAVTDGLEMGEMPQPTEQDGALVGEICWIDNFGNVVTNIRSDLVGNDSDWQVVVTGQDVPSCSTYGELAPGAHGALINSFGYVEIAVNQGNAAAQLGLSTGDTVRLIS